jgi:hypothetical protein
MGACRSCPSSPMSTITLARSRLNALAAEISSRPRKKGAVVIVVAVRPPVVRRGTRHTIDVIGRKADMRGPARFTAPSAALRLSPRTSRREHVARDAAQLSMGAHAPNGRKRAIDGSALSGDGLLAKQSECETATEGLHPEALLVRMRQCDASNVDREEIKQNDRGTSRYE